MHSAFVAKLAMVLLLALVSGSVIGAGKAGRANKAHRASSESTATQPCTGTGIGTICVTDFPRLRVNADRTASASLRVCNVGAPSRLSLTLSDFIAPGDGVETPPFPLDTTHRITAAIPADQPVVDGAKQLKSRECVAVKIDVAGLWQAGLLTATLRNGADTLANVQAVNMNAPFHLKAAGANPDTFDLSLVKGRAFDLTLQNDDEMGYPFRWRLDLPECPAQGEAYVRPNRSVSLKVGYEKCFEDVTWWEAGFLRSATRDGQLVVEYEPGQSLKPYALARREFKVHAGISRFEPLWQSFLNIVAIVFLLLIGIVLSLLIYYVLPMQRRRVTIKERLVLLEGQMAGLDRLVPTRVLSLLRVEKKRLREKLRELWPIDPTTEAALPKFEAQVDWLECRIALVAQAGGLLSRLKASKSVAVPEADEVHAACVAVFEVVERQEAATEDITRARAALDNAAKLLSTAAHAPNDVMLQALRERAEKVRAWSRMVAAPPSDNAAVLSELTHNLLRAVPESPAAIVASNYADVARAVAKAEVVADFVHLLEVAECGDALTRRTDQTAELLSALCPGPDESLARAREIVVEAKQGISADALVRALRHYGANNLQIVADPPTPLPYQRVELRVRMREAGFDTAAARSRIECFWTVDGVEIESHDWTASYYFEKTRAASGLRRLLPGSRTDATIPVLATLKYRNAPLIDVPKLDLKVEAPKSYATASLLLSIGAMTATIVLVTIGLIAGAQEKIQSLNWIAGAFTVLAIGFGADVLTRGLNQPSRGAK
jgi:hypothetical protein